MVRYLKTENEDVCPTMGQPIKVIKELWHGHKNILKHELDPCETCQCDFMGTVYLIIYKKNGHYTIQCLYKGKAVSQSPMEGEKEQER